MIALLQRVTEAGVKVDGKIIGSINKGLLLFIGVEKNDDEAIAQRLADRVLAYRVFADKEDKMNLNIQQVNGGLLIVPQFTLAADTRSGNRPSFSSAAPPAEGQRLFNVFVEMMKEKYNEIETGQFGADMKISLVNDGPVTFWLQVNS